MEKLANDSLSSRNTKLIQKMQKIIENISSSEEVRKLVDQSIKSKKDSEVIYLSFLSSKDEFSEFFEREDFLKYLMLKLKDMNQSEEVKLSIIKIMKEVAEVDEKYIKFFEEQGGIN